MFLASGESEVHRPETTMRQTGNRLSFSDFVKQQPPVICPENEHQMQGK